MYFLVEKGGGDENRKKGKNCRRVPNEQIQKNRGQDKKCRQSKAETYPGSLE